MILLASVVSVRNDHLLVFDLTDRKQFKVMTQQTSRFHSGDLLRIRYNGIATKSIPPQINAQHITKLTPPPC